MPALGTFPPKAPPSRNAASRRAGSIVYVAGSMSTNTGVAPARSMAATVATAVCDTVITASPAPILSAPRPNWTPSVPLAPAAEPPAAVQLDQQLGKLLQADDLATSEVEHAAAGLGSRGGQQQRFDTI